MSLPVGLDEKDSLTKSNCCGCDFWATAQRGWYQRETCAHTDIDKVCSIGDPVTVDQMIKKATFDFRAFRAIKFVLECCELLNIDKNSDSDFDNNSDCDNDSESDSDEENDNIIAISWLCRNDDSSWQIKTSQELRKLAYTSYLESQV